MVISRASQAETLLQIRQREFEILTHLRESILDGLPANVCMIDESGKIVFVNRPWRAFAAANGYRGSDAGQNRNYLDICHSGEADPQTTGVETAIRDILAGRRDVFDSDYPCHSPDEQRWFRCMIRPVSRGAIIMHVDITAQKVAELESRRAEDLIAKVSEQKSILLANLSHEMRTPLNAIIGFSEMMRQGIFGPLPPRYAEYAEHIHFSGRHLLNVVNDLLDLAKIENGQMKLDIEPVAVKSIAEQILPLFSQDAAAQTLDLSIAIAEDILVLADEFRLRQILINLLSNAVKFTPDGGRIRLEAARKEEGAVAISVSDTGVGMSEDEIAIALKPFGQIVNNGTRQKIGTGLGLPLTKQLIEMQGGSLTIASSRGGGSHLTLTLPGCRRH
jgi:signal transduction histidine kinase